MKDFKFALFDFDGTLVDSQWYWQTMLPRVLAERGIRVPEEEIEECLDGDWLGKHEEYRTRYGLTEPLFTHHSEFFPYVDRFYCNEVFWKPTVPEYLEYLKSKDVVLGIFSATRESLLRHGLQRLEGEKYFDYIFSGYDRNLPKTKGESFLACLREMGAGVENTVLFEDALYSIRTAKSIGMTVYAVQERCSRKDRNEIRGLADRFAVRMEEFME